MPANPPPVSYSDTGGYRDNVDDVEALASRALRPISDFPPSDDYDDHSITSSDEDYDDDDVSLSDEEEGQRDATVLRKKTSDILNEFEDFVQDVNTSSTASMEIRNTLTGTTSSRGVDTVKSRITAGGGDAVLNREWSRDDRSNLHDVSFGGDDDFNGSYDKYEKRGFFKYAVPLFHSKKFRFITAGVAVVFVLMLIVGSMSTTGDDQEEVGDLGDVVMVEKMEDDNDDVLNWFYQQTECSDHPSAQVHGEGHACAWIHTTGRVPLRHARCSHETTYKKRNGEFLLVKELCKRSCDECGGVESPAAVATQPEEIKLEPSPTISIDTSTCEDNPTAIITTDGHTCDDFIAHVGRVPLHNARCSHDSPLKNEKGETLLVKDVCRLSCGVCGDAWTNGEQEEVGQPQAQTEGSGVESPAAVATQPEEIKPEPSPTVSIDTSTCEDNPTAIITTDGHKCDDFIAHVGRVPLHNARCSHDSPLKNEKGETLLVKDVCRLSCGVCGDAWTNGEQEEVGQPQAQTEGSGVESPAAVATQPEEIKPEPSPTISIDTSTCEDNPTAIITTDGHTCDDFIAHVGRVPLHNARCSHDSPLKNEKGETLLVKDVCRLSCGVCGDAWTNGEQEEVGQPQAQTEVLEPEVQQPAANDSIGEMTNWMTPVTLNDDSSSSVTSTTDCKDDLTKVVAIGGKTCETYFSDSTLVHLKELRCSHQTDVQDDSGDNFLFVKDICKESCGLCETQSDQGGMSTTTTGQVTKEPSTDAAAEASIPLESPPMPSTQTQLEVGDTESPAAAATETEAPKPEPSTTISIDTSKCEDNPTAIITTDGHKCDDFIAHVGRVPLHNARCSHDSPLKNEKGETLLVKDVCRLSCGVCGDAWTNGEQEEVGQPQAQTEGSGVESSAIVDSLPNDIMQSSLGEDQAQSNAIPTSTVEETKPVESVSTPASETAETAPVESVLSPSTQQNQESSSTEHKASVFTREDGWGGFSSSAAIDFCRGKGLSLCSYEDVCPEGMGNPPVGPPAHNTWVPISDGSDWIQIGSENSCEQWSQTHEGSPPWANAGEVIEEITRTLYCCESDDPVQKSGNAIEDTAETSIQSIPASISGLHEQQAYNFVGSRFAPVWFDRSSGWEGTTYEAAVQFCLSLDQKMILCPYEAYCPLGPLTTIPFGGLRDDDGSVSLAPAINNRQWWVQVGGVENVCEHANFDRNWGEDGSNEEQTRHIMCCKINSD